MGLRTRKDDGISVQSKLGTSGRTDAQDKVRDHNEDCIRIDSVSAHSHEKAYDAHLAHAV